VTAVGASPRPHHPSEHEVTHRRWRPERLRQAAAERTDLTAPSSGAEVPARAECSTCETIGDSDAIKADFGALIPAGR